jgi:hypothetical protein
MACFHWNLPIASFALRDCERGICAGVERVLLEMNREVPDE